MRTSIGGRARAKIGSAEAVLRTEEAAEAVTVLVAREIGQTEAGIAARETSCARVGWAAGDVCLDNAETADAADEPVATVAVGLASLPERWDADSVVVACESSSALCAGTAA